jgi:hypothetical protein
MKVIAFYNSTPRHTLEGSRSFFQNLKDLVRFKVLVAESIMITVLRC